MCKYVSNKSFNKNEDSKWEENVVSYLTGNIFSFFAKSESCSVASDSLRPYGP